MLFRSHRPRWPLSDFIEDFWLYDAYAQPHAMERILPVGTLELVINLRDDALRIYDADDPSRCRTFRGALVSGAFGHPFATDTMQEASMLGVHFRPGGAAPFLGMPAIELIDAHVELETLWGRDARELRERLCRTISVAERFRLLEDALLARMNHVSAHKALAPAIRAFATTTNVREVASHIGLGERRLAEIFKANVGTTPKVFARIQRFHRTLATLGADPDWSRIAIDRGYYDQAHLIRDFTRFSGFTPAAYVRHRDALQRRGVHIKRYHLPV